MTKILDDREFALLKALRGGGDVPEGEEEVAYRLESLGIVQLGFRDENDSYSETGHLSQLGENLFIEERRGREPLRQLLFLLFGPLFAK